MGVKMICATLNYVKRYELELKRHVDIKGSGRLFELRAPIWKRLIDIYLSLFIKGTEAQDGLKAWCDNNSWFCDCTDGGQLDDLFDDVGNFTEVNTGKTVLFDISQITIMKILVEIG